ncbi:hypothetical protein CHUAL_013112 [Chamberlinius hualienensis]
MYFEPNRIIKCLHTATSVTIWSVCIAWIIIACATGQGGILSVLLTWRYWVPLSKLALSIYMVQSTVIEVMCYSEFTTLHYSLYNFIGLILRHLVITIILAIPVSLAFESPNLNKSGAKCYEDLKTTFEGIYRKEDWALSMVDAFGKPGSGILEGNVQWGGNYRQCLNVNNKEIRGRYCWLVFPANTIISFLKQEHLFTQRSIKTAICVPNTCNEADLIRFIDFAEGKIKYFFDMAKDRISTNVTCVGINRKKIHQDPMAVIAISLCCLFALLMFLGTMFDLSFRNQSEKSKQLLKNNNRVDKHFIQSVTPGDLFDTVINNNLKNIENMKLDTASKPSPLAEFLICFSVYTNGKKLLTLRESKTLFPEINGLKAISSIIIIVGHTFLHTLPIVDNPMEMGKELVRWHMQFPANFYYFVDIFFFITGFLTMSILITKFLTTKTEMNLKFVLSYIGHRYWRLATTYGLILLVLRIGIMPHLGSGPFYENLESNCHHEWWKNLLFISNWWPLKEQCYRTTWFMSASMQLHVIALIIIIPLFSQKYKMLSLINGVVILVLSCCWIGWISYNENVPANYSAINRHDISYYLERLEVFKNVIYITPFYHCGSYIVGMATGWILHEYKDNVKFNKFQVTFGWILCCVMVFGVCHVMYFEPNRIIKCFHTATSVTLWSVCIAWIIMACARGQGSNINSLFIIHLGL